MGRLHHGKVGATHRDGPRNGRRHRSVKLVKRGPRLDVLVVVTAAEAGCGGLMDWGIVCQ